MATGTVAETVASDLENVASVTRRLDGRVVSSFGIGLGIGAGIGFYVGYRYSKKKLRLEIYEEAEREITAVREHYQQKIASVDAQDKPAVEDLVRERGYVPDDETEKIEYSRLEDPTEAPDLRLASPPVPVDPPKPESSRRAPVNNYPFLISQEEFHRNESGYARVSYLFYSGDDVLVDEADSSNILANREQLVGTLLSQFTSGSDSDDLLYVRNPQVELDMVIEHIPKSWEEEVLGFDPNETG